MIITTSLRVFFSVSDSGKGLSEAEIAKLFNPEQVAARLPGLDRSLGMGLFVSKILMDERQATISCQNQPGVGTTFEVKILV
ncbi:MAG: ATP-binding protein [Cyanobacteriota/Melainabacteria group bacterium]